MVACHLFSGHSLGFGASIKLDIYSLFRRIGVSDLQMSHGNSSISLAIRCSGEFSSMSHAQRTLPHPRSQIMMRILRISHSSKSLLCGWVAGLLLVMHGTQLCAQSRNPQSEVTHETASSFRNEVMAVLSRSGCNLGTCHGNQNGKGGFKISLRGQDPESDFITLTRQLAGRRANTMNPDDSLLLQKPAMLVPHEGGRRFSPESAEYQLLRNWIAAGMPNDHGDVPILQRLEVSPEMVTLHAPDQSVTLKAIATFTDQSQRDVTHLAVFESSDPSVQISSSGVVQFSASEYSRRTSITVRYLNQQTVSRVEQFPVVRSFNFARRSL
jgi:hypothetical protein